MTKDEWVAIWMLGIVKKRKKLDKLAYQALQDVIQFGANNVVQNFQDKFKEFRVERNRKENSSSASVMLTEEDEWVTIWMLGILKKRKKLDKFASQALQDIIKLGGDNIIQNFEEKFKELRVEGNRKENGSSTSVMFN